MHPAAGRTASVHRVTSRPFVHDDDRRGGLAQAPVVRVVMRDRTSARARSGPFVTPWPSGRSRQSGCTGSSMAARDTPSDIRPPTSYVLYANIRPARRATRRRGMGATLHCGVPSPKPPNAATTAEEDGENPARTPAHPRRRNRRLTPAPALAQASLPPGGGTVASHRVPASHA